LQVYIKSKENSEINAKFQTLEALKQEFIKDNAKPLIITYPKEITDNFLKIISNIFYQTLRKVSNEVKKELLEEGRIISQDEIHQMVRDCYEKNLPGIRKEIFKFFGIPSKGEMSRKMLVRMYVYSMRKGEKVRTAYENLTQTLYKVEANLKEKIFPTEFIDSNSESNMPKNELIDLNRLLSDTVDLKTLVG
jgi:hypothetical protein